MTKKSSIAVAHGDGIGPEIMDATLLVMDAAGAQLDLHKVEIGEAVYNRGHSAGIEPETWDTLRATDAFLKAPITTPQGGGFKSLNVTVRNTLGLFANIRPCRSYHPFVKTKHPNMDVVIVRENEEDLYTGIEYRQSEDSYSALKIITRPGSERIIRYAFEYAETNERKKVTCFTKDNILKLSDGLFHKVFREVSEEYPKIENEHWIIDIGAAKLADTPENFDVVVLPNLYGDILSDIAAQIAGSVGLAGSANVGHEHAMFEAIHGSAPRRAGQNLANPSGLMNGAILMLVHLNQPDVATRMHNAWLCTLEDGIHTYDIFKEGISKQKVGTREFAQAISERIGQKPKKLKPVHYGEHKPHTPSQSSAAASGSPASGDKQLVGVDIFVNARSTVQEIEKQISNASNGSLKLTMISNRGARVWPQFNPETHCADQWRCRFMNPEKGAKISPSETLKLLERFSEANIDYIKLENLYTFAGEPGYSLGADEQ